MTYPFSVFTFTDKEIDQIIQLVQQYSGGRLLPIDRRPLSKQVIGYALSWNLLIEQKGKLFIPRTNGYQTSIFTPGCDLPVEALWRMVAPMLREGQEQTGYSIVNHPGWSMLNIYPQKDRFATERDLNEKVDILLKLSGYHYIHFQMAGTVWCIYREYERITQ